MAGRPRKIVDIATGKIGKEKIKARKEQEKKIKLERDQLIAPSWLNEEAKEEFERVVTEAESIELLDNLDLGILAIYCNAYAAYVDISIQIQSRGYLAIRETRHDEYETVSPLLQAQEKYVKQIMQCSTKLGLATTDRLKLIVPKKEESETNKYLKYLNG
ncbi:phage terminase small subunit P27 family [Peptoniphilus asaccharolyticus]